MTLRLAVPTGTELLLLNVLVGFLQSLFIVAAVRASRRRVPSPARFPKAVVVAACKGAPHGLESHAARLIDQDYPGPVEVLFVLPSQEDPGWGPVSRAAARAPAGKVRVLASGVVPTRSSGKAADLAWALGSLPADAELAVFTEVDIAVSRGWLAAVTAPLADPAVGVATTLAVPVPPTFGVWGILRMVWVAFGVAHFSTLGMVCGQAMAVRVEDIARWGLRSVWERCFADDLALRDLVRRSGRRIRFVHAAMGVQDAPVGRAEFWAVFNRWWMTFRVYEPAVFALGPLLMAFKAYSLVRGLRALPHAALLAATLGTDFAVYAALLAWLAGVAPASFAVLPGGALGRLAAAAAGAVALPWVILANSLSALGPRRTSWGDKTYLLRGRLDVVVEPRRRLP